MARNALKSDFRSSKMAAGGNFAEQKSKNIKVAYVLIRNSEIVDRIFSHPKWPQGYLFGGSHV